MHRSRLFGVTSPEAAAAIMLKGFELGLGLTASFEFITVIQGRPALIPRGALALVLNSGELVEFEAPIERGPKGEPLACTCRMKRRNGLEYTVRYTMDDAARAGLVKPGSGWTTYPENMLRWRAVGYCMDVLFPDITGGMKRADEFGATVDEEGNIVEGTWAPAAPAQPDPPAAPTVTLDDLLSHYSPEEIMEANDGRIPGTNDEVAAVAARLAASNG